MNGPVYRVIWLRSVSEYWVGNLLLELAGRSESSSGLFAAIEAINRLLATDPETCGESRSEGERVLHVPPLTVTFEVHPDEQLVLIVRAHYVRDDT